MKLYKKIDEAMGFVQKLDKKQPKKGKDTKLRQSVDSPRDFDKALKMFMKGAQKQIDNDFKRNYPNLKPNKLGIAKGKRYVKITTTTDGGKGQKSVFCFIDKKEQTFGDILKAASWSAPAKHARGNLFDGSWGLKYVGVYGPAYMR